MFDVRRNCTTLIALSLFFALVVAPATATAGADADEPDGAVEATSSDTPKNEEAGSGMTGWVDGRLTVLGLSYQIDTPDEIAAWTYNFGVGATIAPWKNWVIQGRWMALGPAAFFGEYAGEAGEFALLTGPVWRSDLMHVSVAVGASHLVGKHPLPDLPDGTRQNGSTPFETFGFAAEVQYTAHVSDYIGVGLIAAGGASSDATYLSLLPTVQVGMMN